MKSANTSIDFEYNSTSRFVLENAATVALAASLTQAGSIGYDTTLNVVKYFNGSSVVTVLSSSSSLTAGRIPYVSTGGLLADTSNLAWDNTNAFFSVGSSASNDNQSPVWVSTNVNNFYHYGIKNTSTGTNASSEYSAIADTGTITTNFFALGINNSGFNGTTAGFPVYGTGIGTYLLADGGTLFMGTQSVHGITFHTGGVAASEIRLTISTDGNFVFSNASQSTVSTFITETQAAYTAGNPTLNLITGGAHTNLTASAEIIDINYNLARTVQRATGAVTTQRAFVIQAPTYSFVGASTITTAATFAITGPPIAGTNATLTNTYSLWVQSGTMALGGDIVGTATQNIFNTVTTTANIIGAATTITMGAASGTATIRNTTVALSGGTVTGAATQNVFNTTSTTVNFAGAATTMAIGGTPTTSVTHSYSANATASATTKTINFGTAGASGSTTNINIGSAVAGSASVITAQGRVVWGVPVRTSTSAPIMQVITPADTTLTLSTESILTQIGGTSAQATVTRQWATGALATQRENLIVAPTYAFVGASTITNAVTLEITGGPVAGTNATITNSYALRLGGTLRFITASSGTISFATNALFQLPVGNSYTVQQSGATRYQIAITTGNHSFANASASTGTTAMFSIVQSANTGGSAGAFSLAAGAHTNQTLSTEIIDVLVSLNRTVQWATGALTTQRATLVQAPTYSFVGASTITNAATFAIDAAPVAGTNATITNAYSLWVQTGNSRFDGTEVQVKHLRGTTSAPSIVAGTGAGTGPTVSVSGTDLSGIISITTGSAPAGTNAIIATITFNAAYSVAPIVVIVAANRNSQALTGATAVQVPASGQTNGVTPTTFVMESGATNLTASTLYLFAYHVIQ